MIVASDDWYATGTLIGVGDRRLYAITAGRGTHSVVFDSGLSGGAEAWAAIVPTVQQWARVCAYDRAGIGRSDPGPHPRTSQQIVDELLALLAQIDLPAPSILVGHSFGGISMRLFAAQHPARVAGLVLVDTPHVDLSIRSAPLLPPGVWEAYVQRWNSEGVDLEASFAQLRHAPPLPPMPIALLTAAHLSYPDGWPAAALERVRLELQRDLAQSLPGCRHRIVAQSGHMIQLDQPAVVIATIRAMLARHQEVDVCRS